MEKKSSQLKKDELDELYQAIIDVSNKEDCRNFLDDLLTIQELEALSGRVHAAKLFIQGKTYVEVNKETDISSATLARVSKCVKNGKGYNKILSAHNKKPL